jgi:hypothetical protein
MTPEASVDAMLAAVAAKPAVAKPVESPAAVETPAAEAAATETPAAEAATTQDTDDEYSFDSDNFVGARDLAAKLDAEAANLSPETRELVMANARIAEAMAPYREIFGSPEEAKVIAQSAQDFADITHTFQSIGVDPVKGSSDLMTAMLKMSALKDENGEPRRRENGTFITDGTTTKFFNEIFDRKFNAAIVKKIQDSGDEAAMAALDLVMERAGLRTSTADQDQTDPALAARKAELDAQQAEINRQTQEQRQAAVASYNDALNGELQTLATSEIDKLLAPATGITDFAKSGVVTKLTKAIKEAVRTNSAYRIEKAALEAKPMTAKRRAEEVALATRFFRDHLKRVAQPIFAEAGISISKKAASRAEAQAAREQAARGDVNGSAPGSAGKATDATNPVQARAAIAESLKAKLGRAPSDSEVNIEMMLASPGLRGRAA